MSQMVRDATLERDLQEAFKARQEQWELCTAVQRDCFEEDGDQI